MIMEFFIERFIEEKYETYLKHEPSRKGTPRGEPIGFSREKYKAMLFVMHGIKLIDVARLLNISYQIVRRWNTEEQFQKAIIEHSRQFAEYLISYLQKEIKKKQNFLNNLTAAFNSYQKHCADPVKCAEEDLLGDLLEEHKQWAKILGHIIVAHLQGNYEALDVYSKIEIEYKNCEPVLKSEAISKAEGSE